MRILALCGLGLLASTMNAQEAVRVTVAHPIAHNASHVEFKGTMEPARSIEIRAPVSSKIVKLFVKPGARVARGDLIAELDPGPVEARLKPWDLAVERAKAKVQRAQKMLASAEQFAKLDAKTLADLRTKEVAKFQAAGDKAQIAWKNLALKNTYWKSQGDFRTARETLEQAQVLCKSRPPGTDPLAEVQRLQQALARVPAAPVPLDKDSAAELANLNDILDRLVLLCRAGTPVGREALQAEISLAETVLKTTEEGRERARQTLQQTKISVPPALDDKGGFVIMHVKVGDEVEAGDRSATLLATIVQADTVRTTFAIDEATFLSCQEMVKRKEPIAISLALGPKDKGLPGTIEFDNRIDPKKGVAVVRAVFDNAKGILTDALLSADKNRRAVLVRLTLDRSRPVVLVPHQVILTDPDGTRQILVAKDKKLEIRTVKAGGQLGGMQIVTDGLSTEDLVILATERRDFKNQTLTPEDFASDVRLLRLRPGSPVEPVVAVLRLPEKSDQE